MSGMSRLFLACGAIAGFLAVALGAFGAHALTAHLSPESLAIYQTAVQYQFWHALGLGIVGLTLFQLPQAAPLKWAGILMVLGIPIFCGSLYMVALSGVRTWGMFAPIGGLAWLLAWALFAWAILRA